MYKNLAGHRLSFGQWDPVYQTYIKPLHLKMSFAKWGKVSNINLIINVGYALLYYSYPHIYEWWVCIIGWYSSDNLSVWDMNCCMFWIRTFINVMCIIAISRYVHSSVWCMHCLFRTLIIALLSIGTWITIAAAGMSNEYVPKAFPDLIDSGIAVENDDSCCHKPSDNECRPSSSRDTYALLIPRK